MSQLPEPTPDDLSHSKQLASLIGGEIADQNGWISFSRYMELALYAPGLGYYSAGTAKLGAAGDFVTAPEISTLYGRTLARHVAHVLRQTDGDVLELGAGSGKLAVQLLGELAVLGVLPGRYRILEVSAHLHDMQRQTIANKLSSELAARVEWLDQLPSTFTGIILGNEVLDAIPVNLVVWGEDGISERGVGFEGGCFVWHDQPLPSGMLQEPVATLELPHGYLTESCQAALALVATLATMLERGAMTFIDYGFPRREYYHPQRAQGTLMCHYRHLAHTDPFVYPGLQDITAHVDFTSVAEVGVEHGLKLLGYTGQAQFLIDCGITDLLSEVSPEDIASYLPLASQVQKLLSPAEMGELFKVISLGKGVDKPLPGFTRGDRSHTL